MSSTSSSSSSTLPTVSRGMVKTTLGAIGYLICNGASSRSPSTTTAATTTTTASSSSLLPIFCFHGSPRSSDEFLEVLPLLAASNNNNNNNGSCGRIVIAFDTPGYGISENPPKSCSVDEIADAFLEVADTIITTPSSQQSIRNQFIVFGNLMGNFFAVSLASRYPDRVAACMMSNIYYFPQQQEQKLNHNNDDDDHPSKHEYAEEKKDDSQPLPKRSKSEQQQEEQKPIRDSFELHEDGSHLTNLYNKRKDWLDPELNLRVIQSEITYLVNRRARYARGISIENVSNFDYETPASRVRAPCLGIGGRANLQYFDDIGYHGTRQFEAGCDVLRDCEVVNLEGPKSTINMMNQDPQGMADLCFAFLEKKQI